jgi:hypothetical protein
MAVCAAAFILFWPRAEYAARILAARDDPAALSDIQLNSVLRKAPTKVEDDIAAALEAGDVDLASSFVDLAAARHIALPDQLKTRVADAVARENSVGHRAARFVTGLVTGNAEDVASLSGTVAGDLFVFGDVRDVVRETKHLATGEPGDRLVLGLAAAGLAVTAATYMTAGAAAPARAGLTLVKDAHKIGELGGGLSRWLGRSAREIVDTPALQRAGASGSLARRGETARTIETAFGSGEAAGLLRFAKDVGRIGEKAGVRGAFDALKIADGPKDVARAARLAKAKGSQTRAILKILGRGALLLAAGAFNFATWIFGAVLALLGFLASIKASTERLTESWLRRRKARRHAQRAAEPAALIV